MDKHKNFAGNLKAIQKSKALSLAEFSKELDIPKSTLQSILLTGQTTLDTAIRISDALNIPIDTLTNSVLSAKSVSLIVCLANCSEWFDSLSPEDRLEVTHYFKKILEVLEK